MILLAPLVLLVLLIPLAPLVPLIPLNPLLSLALLPPLSMLILLVPLVRSVRPRCLVTGMPKHKFGSLGRPSADLARLKKLRSDYRRPERP